MIAAGYSVSVKNYFSTLRLHNGGLFCSLLGARLTVTPLVNKAQGQELGVQFICLIPTFRIN